MKPRDGDDAVKDSKTQGWESRGPKPAAIAGKCPACGADIPAKPGFRFSALKCPKCGAAAVKK
jgi:hypothetical protein